jgi:hypothetical protein
MRHTISRKKGINHIEPAKEPYKCIENSLSPKTKPAFS